MHTGIVDCTTINCSAFDDRALPVSASGVPIGLGLLANDLPAFALFAPNSVGAFSCSSATCTTGSEIAVTNTTQSILDGDFALDAAQRPLLAYIDFDTRKLSAAGCDVIFANGFE